MVGRRNIFCYSKPLFSTLYNTQKVGNNYPPCVYFLLPNKTQETYSKMLEALRELIPNADPQIILLDFENAGQNAFRKTYPNASIKGCLFHLSQSVQRKVAQLGLKNKYQIEIEFSMQVKSLWALSFVPTNGFLERFQELADTFPNEEEGVEELLAYFEVTYI